MVAKLWKIFACLQVLVCWSAAAKAADAIVVPALVGGISSSAVFNDRGFFEAAQRCLQQNPFSDFHDAAHRQRDCLARYMKQHGATAQAIAFMRAAPVPAAVSAVHDYAAAMVHARMLWADGSDGWAIVGKSGALVPLWQPPEFQHDQAYTVFLHEHPGSSLWSDQIDWPPSGATDGGQRIPVNFSIKVCHACARLGTAAVIYKFDVKVNYSGMYLKKIEEKSKTP
jgi:hypothetical protein